MVKRSDLTIRHRLDRTVAGLIFAGIGRTLVVAGERVVSPPTYSAVVIMVVITTLLTPPLLKWTLARKSSGPIEAERKKQEM